MVISNFLMPQGKGRYIIHLYCLAVQAGFYSDVVECSSIDRKVLSSILGLGMDIFLRVRDKWRPAEITTCALELLKSHFQ